MPEDPTAPFTPKEKALMLRLVRLHRDMLVAIAVTEPREMSGLMAKLTYRTPRILTDDRKTES